MSSNVSSRNRKRVMLSGGTDSEYESPVPLHSQKHTINSSARKDGYLYSRKYPGIPGPHDKKSRTGFLGLSP